MLLAVVFLVLGWELWGYIFAQVVSPIVVLVLLGVGNILVPLQNLATVGRQRPQYHDQGK